MEKIKVITFTPNAEKVIEEACRCCYQSFCRASETSHEELIKKVIAKGHFSVLEHASLTVALEGSRVMTHELVRHRLMSPSQESQRYVIYADKGDRKKTKDFKVMIPDSIRKNKDLYDRFTNCVNECYNLYQDMLDAGVPPEDARYILPNATVSQIYITANLREWRHIFEVRCNKRAHWEIRMFMMKVLKFCKENFPNVFYDFELSDCGTYAFINYDKQTEFLKSLKKE